jgi:hypothetical protein
MSAVSLLALVIMAEARPVMSDLKAQQEHTTVNLTGDLVLAGLFVLAICIGATIIPLQLGLKRMEEMEF